MAGGQREVPRRQRRQEKGRLRAAGRTAGRQETRDAGRLSAAGIPEGRLRETQSGLRGTLGEKGQRRRAEHEWECTLRAAAAALNRVHVGCASSGLRCHEAEGRRQVTNSATTDSQHGPTTASRRRGCVPWWITRRDGISQVGATPTFTGLSSRPRARGGARCGPDTTPDRPTPRPAPLTLTLTKRPCCIRLLNNIRPSIDAFFFFFFEYTVNIPIYADFSYAVSIYMVSFLQFFFISVTGDYSF